MSMIYVLMVNLVFWSLRHHHPHRSVTSEVPIKPYMFCVSLCRAYVGPVLGPSCLSLGPCWAYVRPCWAHARPMLGPCWAHVGSVLGHVGPNPRFLVAGCC